MPTVDWNQLKLPDLFDRLVAGSALDTLINTAVTEDLGTTGDITSLTSIPPDQPATANLNSRATGRLAGAVLLPLIATQYDKSLSTTIHITDSSTLAPNDTIATIIGPLRSILSAERVILNFICHLSGIASLTARFVDAVAGTNARVYDTRKTIPAHRTLSKYAVRCGGGFCHRIGLFDAVLIKDNHIAHIPPHMLTKALNDTIIKTHTHTPKPAFIQIEVDTLDQLKIVLKCNIDIVLLDNMTPDQHRQAVEIRNTLAPNVELEASGNINLTNIRAIAETGIDRISIGALTHSAPALDLGLDITT